MLEEEMSEFHKYILDFKESFLFIIEVASFSLTLVFEKNSNLKFHASLLIRCPFECTEGYNIYEGDGEKIETGISLFRYINRKVEYVEFSEDQVLTLYFEDKSKIKIIPDLNTVEPYVITNRMGVYTVPL